MNHLQNLFLMTKRKANINISNEGINNRTFWPRIWCWVLINIWCLTDSIAEAPIVNLWKCPDCYSITFDSWFFPQIMYNQNLNYRQLQNGIVTCGYFLCEKSCSTFPSFLRIKNSLSWSTKLKITISNTIAKCILIWY